MDYIEAYQIPNTGKLSKYSPHRLTLLLAFGVSTTYCHHFKRSCVPV